MYQIFVLALHCDRWSNLPQYIRSVKDANGYGMKIHLIVLLHHGIMNHLHRHKMEDNRQTGAKHIVEVIHRFIYQMEKGDGYPRDYSFSWTIFPRKQEPLSSQLFVVCIALEDIRARGGIVFACGPHIQILTRRSVQHMNVCVILIPLHCKR